MRAISALRARAAAAAVAVLATLGGSVFACAVPALGAVPRDGWGFAVADDYWDWDAPGDLPQMGDELARLGPKAFRLQMIWNAADLEHHMERARGMIARAREQGARQVVLTFRKPNDVDVDPAHGYAPPAGVYSRHVERVVAELADAVDVWGPANEPNLDWLPGAAGARRLARYDAALERAVETHDPTALRTSPDFHDRWDLGSIAPYVRAYTDAGGGWGDVVAFHPYAGVQRRSLATVDGLSDLIPPGLRIWVTEVGALRRSESWGVANTPAQQAERALWIAATLARHPRVDRIHYYHLHDALEPRWDSALSEWSLVRRDPWYIWCAAAHGDDASHPDCAPPLAAPAPSPLAVFGLAAIAGRGDRG